MKPAIAVLLLLAAPVAARNATAPAETPRPERTICRTYETTGTLMGGRKTCHTRAEWAAIDQANGARVGASRDSTRNGTTVPSY